MKQLHEHSLQKVRTEKKTIIISTIRASLQREITWSMFLILILLYSWLHPYQSILVLQFQRKFENDQTDENELTNEHTETCKQETSPENGQSRNFLNNLVFNNIIDNSFIIQNVKPKKCTKRFILWSLCYLKRESTEQHSNNYFFVFKSIFSVEVALFLCRNNS